MKLTPLLIAISTALGTAQAQEIIEFKAGDVATAEAFNNNFEVLEQASNTNATTNTEQQTQITAIQDKAITNEQKVAALQTQVTANSTQATSNKQDITELHTHVAANNTQAASNKRGITELNTKVAANQQSITGLDTKVTANQTKATALEQEVAELQEKASLNNFQAHTNSLDLNLLRSFSAQHSESITTLNQSVNDNSQSIVQTELNLNAALEQKSTEIDQNLIGLAQKVSALESTTGSNNFIDAQVNGVTMKVSKTLSQHGKYTLITPTGVVTEVDATGAIGSGTLYFATEDCSGTPYIPHSTMAVQEESYTYANPKLDLKTQIYSVDNRVFYSEPQAELVKLNHLAYKAPGQPCVPYSDTHMATPLTENDPQITGIESAPLIIGDLALPLIVAKEIGVEASKRDVFSNGVKIGYTDSVQIDADSSMSIQVYLSDYDNKKVTLYKDGNVSGFWRRPDDAIFYYTLPSCQGNAYVKVLDNAEKNWWNADKLPYMEVTHKFRYYRLSDTVYKFSDTFQSMAWPELDYGDPEAGYSASNCTNTTNSGEGKGYKMAIEISQPSSPRFETPITIEGWEEPTPIESLPEAY